jgi:hypothetical protein
MRQHRQGGEVRVLRGAGTRRVSPPDRYAVCPPHEGEGYLSTPFSISSGFSSPDWNISRTMSEPPTNSPFT